MLLGADFRNMQTLSTNVAMSNATTPVISPRTPREGTATTTLQDYKLAVVSCKQTTTTLQPMLPDDATETEALSPASSIRVPPPVPMGMGSNSNLLAASVGITDFTTKISSTTRKVYVEGNSILGWEIPPPTVAAGTTTASASGSGVASTSTSRPDSPNTKTEAPPTTIPPRHRAKLLPFAELFRAYQNKLMDLFIAYRCTAQHHSYTLGNPRRPSGNTHRDPLAAMVDSGSTLTVPLRNFLKMLVDYMLMPSDLTAEKPSYTGPRGRKPPRRDTERYREQQLDSARSGEDSARSGDGGRKGRGGAASPLSLGSDLFGEFAQSFVVTKPNGVSLPVPPVPGASASSPTTNNKSNTRRKKKAPDPVVEEEVQLPTKTEISQLVKLILQHVFHEDVEKRILSNPAYNTIAFQHTADSIGGEDVGVVHGLENEADRERALSDLKSLVHTAIARPPTTGSVDSVAESTDSAQYYGIIDQQTKQQQPERSATRQSTGEPDGRTPEIEAGNGHNSDNSHSSDPSAPIALPVTFSKQQPKQATKVTKPKTGGLPPGCWVQIWDYVYGDVCFIYPQFCEALIVCADLIMAARAGVEPKQGKEGVLEVPELDLDTSYNFLKEFLTILAEPPVRPRPRTPSPPPLRIPPPLPKKQRKPDPEREREAEKARDQKKGKEKQSPPKKEKSKKK